MDKSKPVHINWVGQYFEFDGYGRFNARFVEALRSIRVEVNQFHVAKAHQCDPSLLTITCLPPFELQPVPGRHWLFTMTEGSRIPPSWVDKIAECNIERVVVPCQHNADAFRDSGVQVPISVVPGGISPDEFPLVPRKRHFRPYVFLTLADRGSRKGWEEVWAAFYQAFGGKTTGNQDVRLIIKHRAGAPTPVHYMCNASESDKRIVYQESDATDMWSVYAQADCVVLPSRSEGWGLPHREAAAMGLPVITQKYSGMDDGCTEEWALVVKGGKIRPIAKEVAHCLGDWMIADVPNLAQIMLWAFHSPETAQGFGASAATWLRRNQTWRHSATKLNSLLLEAHYG